MPQYWHVVEALVALARHKIGAGKRFTRAQLAAWSEKLAGRPRAAQMAIEFMAASGMVRRVPKDSDQKLKPGTWCYQVTPEGAAASKAAHDAYLHEARAAGCRNGNANRPRNAGSFSARLWVLLRLRKTLTAPEAAATLVDAGGNVRRAAATAVLYLRAWSRMHPDAIQVGAKRVAGSWRFVLIRDLGPEAPVIPNKSRAPGGTAE